MTTSPRPAPPATAAGPRSFVRVRWAAPVLALALVPMLGSVPCLALSAAASPVGQKPTVLKGPFGLEAGSGREQIETVLGKLSVLKPSIFMTSSVPGDLPGLDTLTLVVTPNQGLCRIQATSGLLTASSDGAEVRRRFDELRDRLEARFGDYRLVDTLIGAGDGKPFIAQLLSRERALLAVWSAGSGSTLGFNLESVTLSARALEADQAFLTIDYVYTIWDYCQPSLAGESLP